MKNGRYTLSYILTADEALSQWKTKINKGLERLNNPLEVYSSNSLEELKGRQKDIGNLITEMSIYREAQCYKNSD